MGSLSLVVVVGIFVGIYALLAIGMNMHWGDTGLLNFAHAAFFGVGAYTSTILTTPTTEGLLVNRVVGFEFPILVGMVGGTALAGVLGVLVAVTSVRLEGDYLAMVSLSVAEIVRLAIHNEGWLTSGAQGIKDIPRPLSGTFPLSLPVITVGYDLFYLGLVAAITLGSYLVFVRLQRSPFGRVLHAVREDEDVPRALGKRTALFKLKSFGLGAALAGLAGSLWAHYVFAINPATFTASLTFMIWAAVIIGGAGSYAGAVVGATFIVGIRQVTRFLPSDVPLSGELPFVRLIVIGVALIGVLYYRPEGLLGDSERMEAGTVDGGDA